MIDPDTILGAAGLISLFLLGIGSWVIHRKLRTRSSLALVSTLVISAAWVMLISGLVHQFLLGMSVVQESKTLLNIAFLANNVVIPALLLVAFSASFFAVARTIRAAV